jgi:hypothetical protein
MTEAVVRDMLTCNVLSTDTLYAMQMRHGAKSTIVGRK